MKMKKFFSGILAAVMSIATIAMPLSTANADDPPATDDKCIITINHAATTGTYTAYPIFVGNVEPETDNDGKETGRMVINNLKFHANLETAIDSGSVVSRVGSNNYGLWYYLKSSGAQANGGSFLDMIKAYDPNHGFGTSFSMSDNGSYAQQAEALANLLNLTSSDTAVSAILAGTKTSAFYSAFAEAARLFMIDNVAGKSTSDLTGTAVGTLADGKVTIEVDEPGYYLVEYTPDDYMVSPKDEEGNETKGDPVVNEKYTNSPRAVRRSLVLVGKGTELSATINSKDTQNIASVDIQFNETMLVQGEDGTFSYGDKPEGEWSKNVSAGNGDYVNCRIVVTLPGNLADYDQYYLAVPIMYGYNSADKNYFDFDKSITRVSGTYGKMLNHIKTYFIDNDGNKTQIIKDPGSSNTNSSNFTETASEIFKGIRKDYSSTPGKDHNATFEIKDTKYTYANDGSDANSFVAAETFVISDIANMYVRTKWAFPEGRTSHLLKSSYANPEGNDNWSKFVIEFPVKFERYKYSSKLVDGSDNPGFNGSGSASYGGSYVGDDALLKNYITAKAVYSNNPNLKALTAEEKKADGSPKDDNNHLYLDTSKDPGTLQNPVGIAKESSANIVTYRLRVHATTEDLVKLSQVRGVGNIQFVLKDSNSGDYAIVKSIATPITYDTVSGEILKESSYTSSTNYVRFYKITGWVDDCYSTTEEGEETLNTNCVLSTHSNSLRNGIVVDNNNTGRFEIVGLAPGDYTLIALDEKIKTYEDFQPNTNGTNYKDYTLPKENNRTKTEYRFSFAPELLETCTKLPYNTHYAPIDADGNWYSTGSYKEDTTTLNAAFTGDNPTQSIISATDVLITNLNMKWYKGEELITDETNKPDWWLGQREDVGLMSMRVTYIKMGLTLPVTGGIGTFIFFAVGGALVVISTVAIVTKLRIKREQL